MTEKTLAILVIVVGSLLLLLMLAGKLRDIAIGKRTLYGKVIAVNARDRILRIRYQIAKNTYHEFDWKHDSYYLPEVGLGVQVAVPRDDPYHPVTVLLSLRLLRGSPIVYANSSRLRSVLAVLLLIACILCGILMLAGVL